MTNPKTNMYKSLHTTVFGLEGNLFENVKVDTLNQIIEEIRRSNKMESNRYFKALVELKTKLESNKR